MGSPRWFINLVCTTCVIFLFFPTCRASSRDKKDTLPYGLGLVVNVPAPEADVLRAVEEVVQNGVIRGSKEYAKDEFVSGATPASDSTLFEPWTDGGKIFYKVRQHALDPRNFKDGGDVGTLAVRYVVMKRVEVLIVISTPYWFGVETHDGQHGWISRAELEELP
jgi:hypothetical protein